MPVFGQKDGIDNVVVQFSRDPPVYRAGENLEGSIVVICDDATPVKGIKVPYF
jgi:hypothetical protein